jgi:protein-disulfide isomerase
VERQIIAEFVSTGQARFEYHHYIVVDVNVGGSESRRAAEASECANEQSEFWDYNKMVFTNQQGEGQGAFSDRRLKAFAEKLGLDTAKFNPCFDSKRYASNVLADEALARSLGVTSTPTVFVNDTQVQNPLDLTQYRSLVQAALNP